MFTRMSKFAGVLATVALLASIALAQQVRVYHDGGAWIQETSGTLAAAKNLHVRVDFGSVRVQGGSQQDITYIIRTRSYNSDERQARRDLDAYKVTTSARGDTAWIEGDWQGHRHQLCSGEFVINVPRDLNLAKLETSGGGVAVNGITGRVEAESGGGKVHLDDIGG